MPITSTELFSHETIDQLIVEPLFRESVVLDTLRTIRTDATELFLPKVDLGNAEFVAELDPLPDAAVDAAMVQVVPKKVGAIQIISNESVDDANAASIIGEAVVAGLADRVDHAAFVGDEPIGPSGLPGIVGTFEVAESASASLDPYVDAIAAIESAGGVAGAIFVAPTTWAALQQLKVTVDSQQPVIATIGGVTEAQTRAIFGVPVRVSRHVPEDEAWVVDTNRTVAVVRQPFTAQIDYSAEFARDAAVVRVVGRVEFASVYPATTAHIASGS